MYIVPWKRGHSSYKATLTKVQLQIPLFKKINGTIITHDKQIKAKWNLAFWYALQNKCQFALQSDEETESVSVPWHITKVPGVT